MIFQNLQFFTVKGPWNFFSSISEPFLTSFAAKKTFEKVVPFQRAEIST